MHNFSKPSVHLAEIFPAKPHSTYHTFERKKKGDNTSLLTFSSDLTIQLCKEDRAVDYQQAKMEQEVLHEKDGNLLVQQKVGVVV